MRFTVARCRASSERTGSHRWIPGSRFPSERPTVTSLLAARSSDMGWRVHGVVYMLLALVVALACGSGPSRVGTTHPAADHSVVFDDRFAVLVGNTVRRESGPEPLFVLGIASDSGGVVSPDGRRLAYWANSDLRIIDVAPGAQPRTLLAIADDEGALYFAWSTDGTGLVVGVSGGGGGFADAPPGYTALRVVDVAGGTPREIARIRNANVVPLAWDRQARLIAAYEPTAAGTYRYDVVSESGSVKQTTPQSTLYFLEASHDAQQVFGRIDLPTSAIRVWPVGSYELGANLAVPAGENVLAVAWRPATAEIGVLFPDRLELWNASCARRTFALPPAPPSSDTYTSLCFHPRGQ